MRGWKSLHFPCFPGQYLLVRKENAADIANRVSYANAPPVLGVLRSVRTEGAVGAARRRLRRHKRAGHGMDQRRKPVDDGRPVH